MAGILRYGTYVPYNRLDRSRLHRPGTGERSVASFDEDATSMAVEAGREALRGAERTEADILFASTSHPYAEKLNAAVIHAALDLPAATCSADLACSSRSGLAALALASRMAGDRRVMACASDIVVGAPLGPRESAGGDAAVTFLVGTGPDVGAAILGTASRTTELLDVWRGPEQPFARQWEERFALGSLAPAAASALRACLRAAGLKSRDLSRVAIDSTHPRIAAATAKAAGLTPEQLADSLSDRIGRSGAAHAGLLLASLLDSAQPGEKLGAVCAADGAEAVIVEATERIELARPAKSVADWLASKRSGLPYETYLRWRGVLPSEPPRRPEPPRPAAPPMRRSRRWKHAFVGSRCRSCRTANLPPQRICASCGAIGDMEDLPLSDAAAKVATYTVDHLAYSLQRPVVAAVVDFDRGGRFACELTDVDPRQVAIGQQLEMTFRRLYTADGVRNYFWKARPRR